MPFHTPNSSTASAKLLRAFAAGTSPAPLVEDFAVATDATAEPVLSNLINQLTTAAPTDKVDDALHAVFNLSNALPPHLLAPHWRTICQKVLAICKQSTTPRTLAALSALIVSSIPLSSLGSEQRAVVAGIAKQCLQNASLSLSVHPREALCLILSVIHAAPRELRAQSYEDHLFDLLAHPHSNIRTLAARVLAEILNCVPEKQKQDLFTQRALYVNEQVGDILALLDAFTGGKYEGKYAEKTARQICDHLDGLCRMIVNLLDLPMRLAFPLGDVLKTFCDGVRERAIDPYAVVNGVKVTHDEMLFIIPHVQSLSARTVADIAQRVHKLALQAFVKEVGKIFEMRLSKVLLRSRDGDGLACVSERRELYESTGRLVTSLGTGFLYYIAPRFQELFEIDVALYKNCLAGEQKLKVDPVDNIQSGGRSRKRKRQNGRRDSSLGGHVLTKNSALGLTSVYGKQTGALVERTVKAAFDVMTRIFDCRGILTKEVMQHLERIEGLLLEFMEEKKLSPMLLRAVTSAALSGGSRRMTGKASVLLMPLVTACTTATLDPNCSLETRDAALVARAGCEAIIHPRGPPYLQESRMYPTVIRSEHSGKGKLFTKRDQKQSTEKATSEQNGTLHNRDDTETGKLSSDIVDHEIQDRLPNKKPREDNEKKDIKGTPADDLMEVEEANEIRPLPTTQNEKSVIGSNSKSNGNMKVIPETEKELKESAYKGSMRPLESTDKDNELAQMMKASEKEELQSGSSPRLESAEAKGDGVLDIGGNSEPSQQMRESTETEREEGTSAGHKENAQAEHEEGGSEDDDEQRDLEKEDQALIASLVFDPPDEE